MLTREVKARLRPLCTHFPEYDFDTMVNEIVDTQLRGETRTSTWGTKVD
jgi:hypothetical protein